MQIKEVYLPKPKVEVENTLIGTKPDSINVDCSWKIRSNPVKCNTDTERGEGGIESVILTGCPYQVWIKFREHVRGFLSPGTTQTVRITQVSVKRGLTVLNQVHKIPYFYVEYSQRNHQVFASFKTFTDLFFFFWRSLKNVDLSSMISSFFHWKIVNNYWRGREKYHDLSETRSIICRSRRMKKIIDLGDTDK